MALIEEHTVARAVVVCLEKYPRILGSGLEVLPWQDFLEGLWSGGIGV
jgi:hypothetical protein